MWDSVALQLETVISACDFCCVGLWVGLITAAIACEMQAVFWGCEPVKKKQKNPSAFVLLDCPARTAAVKYAGDQRTPAQRPAEIRVIISESAAT